MVSISKNAIGKTHEQLLDFLISIDKILERVKKGDEVNNTDLNVLRTDVGRCRSWFDELFKALERGVDYVAKNKNSPDYMIRGLNDLKREVQELAKDIKTHLL